MVDQLKDMYRKETEKKCFLGNLRSDSQTAKCPEKASEFVSTLDVMCRLLCIFLNKTLKSTRSYLFTCFGEIAVLLLLFEAYLGGMH